jgi:uncharacterized protein (TIGR00106 family)
MPVAEISVVPVGTGSASISTFVVGALRVVKASGLRHELTAMGTNVEGSLEQIFSLARRMHRSALRGGAVRCLTTVKIDDRIDKPLTMKGKVASVRRKLRR